MIDVTFYNAVRTTVRSKKSIIQIFERTMTGYIIVEEKITTIVQRLTMFYYVAFDSGRCCGRKERVSEVSDATRRHRVRPIPVY